MNPLLTGMNNPMMQRLKQTMQILKGVRNPQAMLEQAISSNPQLAEVLKNSNGDYKKAFYDLAEKQGIDPDEILNAMKNGF